MREEKPVPAENPYQPPLTNASLEQEKISVTQNSIVIEETPVMKWAGRGSYISTICSFVLGAFFLGGSLSFMWLIIPMVVLGLSALTYIFASAFQDSDSPSE